MSSVSFFDYKVLAYSKDNLVFLVIVLITKNWLFHIWDLECVNLM